MNRALIVSGLLVVFLTAVQASPPPPLPWVTSNFSVALDSGKIDFRMDCPEGKLTRLSATRDQQAAAFPVDRLAEFELEGRCSGVSTNAELETEGSPSITGIKLTVKFSQEYINEELWITFDTRRFEFTEVMWLNWFPGENTRVSRIKLP